MFHSFHVYIGRVVDPCYYRYLHRVGWFTTAPIDVQTHPKLSSAYFAFLFVTLRCHIGNVASLPPPLFHGLILSLLVRAEHRWCRPCFRCCCRCLLLLADAVLVIVVAVVPAAVASLSLLLSSLLLLLLLLLLRMHLSRLLPLHAIHIVCGMCLFCLQEGIDSLCKCLPAVLHQCVYLN